MEKSNDEEKARPSREELRRRLRAKINQKNPAYQQRQREELRTNLDKMGVSQKKMDKVVKSISKTSGGNLNMENLMKQVVKMGLNGGESK